MNIIKLNIYQTFHFNIIKLSRRISTFSKPLIICLLDKRENIEFWSNTYFLIPIVLYLLVFSTLPRHFVGLYNSACSNRQDSWLLSNRRSRSRFDYQKEERRKKKEETRIIYFVAIKKSRTVHSAPIPSSWKRIIYLVAIKKPKTGSIFCPNSPQNWLFNHCGNYSNYWVEADPENPFCGDIPLQCDN